MLLEVEKLKIMFERHTYTNTHTLHFTRKFRPMLPSLTLYSTWIFCALWILKSHFLRFTSISISHVQICAAQSTPESNGNDKKERKEQWLGTPKKLWKTTSNDTARSHFCVHSRFHTRTQADATSSWLTLFLLFLLLPARPGIAGYRRKLLLSRLIRNAKLSLMLYEKWNQNKNK